MGWVILIIIVAVIGAFMDSGLGKVAVGAGVLGLGLLLLEWITDFAILAILAKVCAVVIVLIIVWAILSSIFS